MISTLFSRTDRECARPSSVLTVHLRRTDKVDLPLIKVMFEEALMEHIASRVCGDHLAEVKKHDIH